MHAIEPVQRNRGKKCSWWELTFTDVEETNQALCFADYTAIERIPESSDGENSDCDDDDMTVASAADESICSVSTSKSGKFPRRGSLGKLAKKIKSKRDKSKKRNHPNRSKSDDLNDMSLSLDAHSTHSLPIAFHDDEDCHGSMSLLGDSFADFSVPPAPPAPTVYAYVALGESIILCI